MDEGKGFGRYLRVNDEDGKMGRWEDGNWSQGNLLIRKWEGEIYIDKAYVLSLSHYG